MADINSNKMKFINLPEKYDLVVGDTFELFYKYIIRYTKGTPIGVPFIVVYIFDYNSKFFFILLSTHRKRERC